MAAVELRRSEFLLLSALMDGEPRTYEEIQSVAHWKVHLCHLAKIIRSHSRYGWIERGRFRRAISKTGRTGNFLRSAYRITEAGRRIWTETSEFWLFTIRQASKQGSPSTSPLEPKPDFRVVPLVYHRPRHDRRATEEEAALLLSKAPPEVAIVCRAVWCDVLTFQQLAGLLVGDVDLAEATACVTSRDGRRIVRLVRLPGELLSLIEQAIAGREAGPVFRNSAGKPWTHSRVGTVIRALRRSAGLPEDVKFLGRFGAGGGRRRKATA